jgi:hypothetical protein
MTDLTEAITRPAASITEAINGGPPTAPDNKWIQTASGLPFWPLNPRAQDLNIDDIAHAISMKCRYTGHTLAAPAQRSRVSRVRTYPNGSRTETGRSVRVAITTEHPRWTA